MPRTLRTHLFEDEINSLIKAAPNLRDKIIIRFLFRTACRVSELCSIKLDDIDLAEGLVLIQHLKRVPRVICPACGGRTGSKSKFCPKCGGSLKTAQGMDVEQRRRRLIPIDHETCKLIEEYLSRRSAESDRLMPLTRQSVDEVIKRATKLAGLDGIVLRHPDTGKSHRISAHRLRDAFVIRSLEQDNSVDSQLRIQKQLGHKSFATTASYAKFELKDSRDWYDGLWKDGGD